jgi:hypothetical protein
MVLFYLLLPQQIELDWDWQSLIAAASHDWLWLEHLTNAFYALVLVVWEPIYVACGFSLYLNRRTVLEAWDIELVFRRMRQRLSSAAAILLVALIVLIPNTQTLWAAEPVMSPDAPRLLDQPLTSQASRDSIKAILEQPPFKNNESVTRYRFGEEQSASQSQEDGGAPDWLKTLLKLLDGQGFGAIATLLEVLLWGTLIAGVRQPPTDPPSPSRAGDTQATVRAQCASANPARRCRGGGRTTLAEQSSRSAWLALSRVAQPFVA